jgi:serine/threonine protein kinase
LKQSNVSERSVNLEKELKLLQMMQGSSYIVQCYGHTNFDNNVYVVMERAPYGSLHDILFDDEVQSYLDSELGARLMLQWMFEIVSGLAHMHRFSVRHGDIKPLNVLVFEGLQVKLADLGFSLRTCAQASLENTFAPMVVSSHSESKLDLSVSRYSGSLMNGGGTIGFMAPETTFTLASDIYSFGITCVVIVLQCNVNGVQDALRRAARWWNQQTNDEAAIQLIDRTMFSTATT